MADPLSSFAAHFWRFVPYQLRETSVTPGEKETLVAAGVNDRTEQMYLAWRRTTLFALALASLLLAFLAALVALVEGEMFTPSWYGVLMKLLRSVSLFALPASALAAALMWTNFAWSRWLLAGGWLIGTLTPLVIGLVPCPYLTIFDLDDARGLLCATVQVFRVLAIFLALTPGAVRAGLWLKSLRPVSLVAGWSVAIATGIHVVVYWIVFLVLSQLCGNNYLFAAALVLIGAPLVYALGYRWLIAPAGPGSGRNLLMARGLHLAIASVGLVLLLMFLFTKTFDPVGERLVGWRLENALIRPGTLIVMAVEFVVRSFFTSVVVTDVLEQLHRVIGTQEPGDSSSEPAS